MSQPPPSPDSTPFDAYLLALINAVADGVPVDWAEAERRATSADERQMLQQLRTVANLAAAADQPSEACIPVGDESVSEARQVAHEERTPAKFGRYVIDRCLGKGSFGVVYKAYDQERRTHVALKAFTRSDVDGVHDFKNEFRAMADLSHPNLVSLYELFADDDSWCIAMELVPGVDFLTYVREGIAADADVSATAGQPPIKDDLTRLGHAMTQLCQALAYLHSEGKLHCDIKPSNVLIASGGHLKLVDFGLATDVFPGLIDDTLRIRGTPGYVSPEHAAGERPTGASDWYGVGVMLFEALTGERPFEGTVSQGTRRQATASRASSQFLAKRDSGRGQHALYPTAQPAAERAPVRRGRPSGSPSHLARLDRRARTSGGTRRFRAVRGSPDAAGSARSRLRGLDAREPADGVSPRRVGHG